jgi:DNA-binding MarR family transcriptional regulator
MKMPRPASLLDLTAYRLSLAGKAARNAVAARLAQDDLRLGDLALLASLRDDGPAAQRVLAERLALDPSDVLRLVDALEARDWVRRERDPADRRRTIVSLTARGGRALDAALEACREAQDAALAPLSARERATLHELAGRLLG